MKRPHLKTHVLITHGGTLQEANGFPSQSVPRQNRYSRSNAPNPWKAPPQDAIIIAETGKESPSISQNATAAIIVGTIPQHRLVVIQTQSQLASPVHLLSSIYYYQYCAAMTSRMGTVKILQPKGCRQCCSATAHPRSHHSNRI
jgi:hypothetical protein